MTNKHICRVYGETGEIQAEVPGKLFHQAAGKRDLPAVGDWVVLSPRTGGGKAAVEGVLPRKSLFVRKAAGNRTEEQVVAANVDVIFLVSGLDGDYNPRRIERYLLLAAESGAEPVVVLNKADLCIDAEARVAEVKAVAAGVPVIVSNAKYSEDFRQLSSFLGPGRTAAFLGSSGVGKSTLINRLLGREAQKTGEVRAHDARGRHTTTHRELIVLDKGGCVIDTPGMRELQLWSDGEGLRDTFEDIEERAAVCRFGDCRHENEPDCAVRAALDDGTLDAERFENYLTLKRELHHLAVKKERNKNQRSAINKQPSAKKRAFDKNQSS